MLKEKDYCDYETCVALKELGYNQYTSLRSYAGKGGVRLWDFDGEPNYKEGELIALSDMYDIPRDGNEIAAPSLYEAQKWLREVKKIDVFVRAGILENRVRHYYAEVFTSNDVIIIGNYGGDYDSYEEALSEGVRASIKILQDEQKENN